MNFFVFTNKNILSGGKVVWFFEDHTPNHTKNKKIVTLYQLFSSISTQFFLVNVGPVNGSERKMQKSNAMMQHIILGDGLVLLC